MADEEQEFQEEEMWGGVAVKQKERREGFTTKKKKSLSSYSSTSCLSSAWQIPTHKSQEKMVSKGKTVSTEGKNLTFRQASAPIKIPGWYDMKNSNKGSKKVDDDGEDEMNINGDGYFVENEDDGEDEETMVPPHEYMAKKMARTRSASHSMCEGVGRTLKGRDLCKLRNAILTQTGFLEK